MLNLDANIQTDVVFLNFGKAFGKAPHTRPMLKLTRQYSDPLVVVWIGSFLHERH